MFLRISYLSLMYLVPYEFLLSEKEGIEMEIMHQCIFDLENIFFGTKIVGSISSKSSEDS